MFQEREREPCGWSRGGMRESVRGAEADQAGLGHLSERFGFHPKSHGNLSEDVDLRDVIFRLWGSSGCPEQDGEWEAAGP